MLDRYEVIRREDENSKGNIQANIMELENEKARLEKSPMLLYKKYKAQAITREEFMLEKEKANMQLSEVERQIANFTVQLGESQGYSYSAYATYL